MFSKTPKIVSKKIRQSAKGENCSLRVTQCSGNDTVVLAHLNSEYKGIGNKSPDIFGIYCCARCHYMLDQNIINHKDQLRALQETQIKLYQKGLIEIK